jgi:uncharacterized zinc-type alcohol dehydrogenase-like protein
VALSTAAYAAHSATTPLEPWRLERRDPGPGDVQIDILYCGVCHTDIHFARNEWDNAVYPMVPGHEIAGVVVRAGANVTRFKAGDRVGVGCLVDSCRACGPCQSGEEQYCAEGATLTYNSEMRDGSGITYGGYSTQIVVDQDFVVRMPGNLPLDAAAPLLCAGITTYSPLRHWRVGEGARMAVVGLGGLGHMAVKFGRAMGAHVTVLSHSPGKKADAMRLGAHAFLVTHDPEVLAQQASRFDFILDTVSAAHDLTPYLGMLDVDRTMVLVGLPEPAPLPAFPLVWRRRSLAGSLIGGLRETQEMLDFCGEKGIVCDIETIAMRQINEAYERMLRSDVRYRFVIDMSSLKG